MKLSLTFLICFLLLNSTFAQTQSYIVTKDIDNFWEAYDHISQTTDTALQRKYINELFIDKGTPGLKGIMEVRNYTDQSYLDAIKNYPLFWWSVRKNTFKTSEFSTAINKGIARLSQLYILRKPATVYFTIGALRTNGTTLNNSILIGSELAMADSSVNTTEFPASLDHLKTFFKSNPIQSVVFGNIHEYVHTQQKTTIANTLLGQCILEGIAEFLAVKASGQMSPNQALTYGPAHNNRIKDVFTKHMFNPRTGFWLYSNQTNEFGVRDMGYYVGYAICEQYYNRAKNKRQAIKEMVELDYNDLPSLLKFADRSGYFNEQLAAYYNNFEASRPVVVSVNEIIYKQNVSTAINKLTVNFSTKMNTRFRGFEFGPLGEANALKLKSFIGFSEDGKSASFEIELKPNQQYQLLLSDRFEDVNGMPLKPYLIEFTTGSN